MKTSSTRSNNGKFVIEKDFPANKEWCVKLRRVVTSRLTLVPYLGECTHNETSHFIHGDSVLCAPDENEIR